MNNVVIKETASFTDSFVCQTDCTLWSAVVGRHGMIVVSANIAYISQPTKTLPW